MATWVSIEDLQAAWPDALIDVDELTRLLNAAQEQLERYAPALPDGEDAPFRYQQALIMHVRELWRAAERDGDVLGIGEYTVRARDLTASVKALLRPKKAVPGIR